MKNLIGTDVFKRVRVGVAVAATVMLLASCGGNDDNGMAAVTQPPVASNTPPDSASADIPGFIAFLKTLVPTQPETTQPLDVTMFVAPMSDTAVPDPSI